MRYGKSSGQTQCHRLQKKGGKLLQQDANRRGSFQSALVLSTASTLISSALLMPDPCIITIKEAILLHFEHQLMLIISLLQLTSARMAGTVTVEFFLSQQFVKSYTIKYSMYQNQQKMGNHSHVSVLETKHFH